MLICGNFNLYCEDSKIYHVNDLIPYSEFKNNDLKECPFYFGEVIEPFKSYEINSRLKAWVMNKILTKIPKQFAFYVYMLVESNKPNHYLCVGCINSPPFIILSSRRNKSNQEVNSYISSIPVIPKPPFSPIDNDNEEDKTSSNMIKSKEDHMTFKFDYLMPHIYDEDISSHTTTTTIDNFPEYIERTVDSDREIEEMMNNLYLSKPNTICKLNTTKGQIKMRVVNKTEISKERKELSFYGEDVDKFEKKHVEYLDKYGNRCIVRQGCYFDKE